MDNQLSTDVKKKNIILASKVAGVGIVSFVIAPLVFVAIQGLMGLIVVGVIVIAGINLVPLFVDYMANMKLVGIKWMASKNPVETLQLDYAKREEALSNYLVSIRNFNASILTFQGKYKKFTMQYPEEKEKFDGILKNMQELYAERVAKYKDAEKSLAQYNLDIQKASSIWDMSVEAGKMNAAAGFDRNDAIEKIKEQTSFDSIEQNMNSAFADLQTSLIQNDAEKNFSEKVIDVEAVAK